MLYISQGTGLLKYLESTFTGDKLLLEFKKHNL